MTTGSGDEFPNTSSGQSSGYDQELQAQSQRRQIPKTMMEPGLSRRAARRVAKTFIEAPLPSLPESLSDQAQTSEGQEQALPQTGTGSATGERARRRIAKTMMENDALDYSGDSLTGAYFEEGLTSDAPFEVSAPRNFVARTMLDNSALQAAVSKFVKKKEARVIEEIKDYKLALACEYRWPGDNPKERVRSCGTCKTWLYNFDGLELPDAEALIFKHQAKKKATLYKRPDGKFMTVDCPVELKRKRDKFVLLVGGTLGLIIVIALLAMIPKPPPPVVVNTPADTTDGVPQKRKKKRVMVPTRGPDGSIHFELDKTPEVEENASPTQSTSDAPGAATSASSSASTSSGGAAAPATGNTISTTTSTTTSTTSAPALEQNWEYANPADAENPVNQK